MLSLDFKFAYLPGLGRWVVGVKLILKQHSAQLEFWLSLAMGKSAEMEKAGTMVPLKKLKLFCKMHSFAHARSELHTFVGSTRAIFLFISGNVWSFVQMLRHLSKCWVFRLNFYFNNALCRKFSQSRFTHFFRKILFVKILGPQRVLHFPTLEEWKKSFL